VVEPIASFAKASLVDLYLCCARQATALQDTMDEFPHHDCAVIRKLRLFEHRTHALFPIALRAAVPCEFERHDKQVLDLVVDGDKQLWSPCVVIILEFVLVVAVDKLRRAIDKILNRPGFGGGSNS
jgi:hypothetical protein